jgi:hypothetical protein
MVQGKIWRKAGVSLHWAFQYYWHVVNKDGIHCWEEQGMAYLQKHPYNQGERGGQPLGLDYDTNKKRIAVLRRHAKYMQKIRQAMQTDNVDRVIRLANSADKLKEEILPLGGVPKSW